MSGIGHMNTIEVSHCVTLLSPFNLCYCSWLSPCVIVILYRHRVRLPSAVGDDYGFLNYHTIFIPKYFVPNLPDFFHDKIMYFRGLYCPKVWNEFTISKVEKFINPHWLLQKFWVLEVQLWGWNSDSIGRYPGSKFMNRQWYEMTKQNESHYILFYETEKTCYGVGL